MIPSSHSKVGQMSLPLMASFKLDAAGGGEGDGDGDKEAA